MAEQELNQILSNILSAAGLESLAPWVIEQQVAGKDYMTILTEMRKLPQYVARFPAMTELQAKAAKGTGVPVNEYEYLQAEQQYRRIFQMSGLPANMWDTPDDYARLLTSDISADEVARRVDAAKIAVYSTDPNTRAELQRMYGIGTSDLMAYALDPEKNSEYLRKVATTSTLAGYSKTAGISDLSTQAWEGYAQDLINQNVGESGIRDVVASADTIREQQLRLAGIEGEQFTTSDAMDIAIRKDADKVLASQRRVEKEKARFSGTQGIGTGSLRGSGI